MGIRQSQSFGLLGFGFAAGVCSAGAPGEVGEGSFHFPIEEAEERNRNGKYKTKDNKYEQQKIIAMNQRRMTVTPEIKRAKAKFVVVCFLAHLF